VKTSRNQWLAGAIGALVGIAIVAAFGDGVVPAEPGALQQTLLTGANLGLAILEFIGVGFALGLIAFGVRQLAAGRSEKGRQRGRTIAVPEYAPLRPAVIAALPLAADATASEFDDVQQPVFAPVTSLTEAQVARERARRKRLEQRAASERA
jgi:hypothetical protein